MTPSVVPGSFVGVNLSTAVLRPILVTRTSPEDGVFDKKVLQSLDRRDREVHEVSTNPRVPFRYD